MIRSTTKLALAALAGLFSATPLVAADNNGWVSLFDGKTLDGWRTSENPESFRVEDGILIADGPRAHLFYEGSLQDAKFKDFEMRIEVKTTPGANSGIFFHTQFQDSGWPEKGYEVQINATHSDPIKTGSIYNAKNLADAAPHKDGEWFRLHFIVKGNEVLVNIDDKVVNHYVEPDDVTGPKKFGEGTVSIQAHDPESVVHFRNIELRVLDEVKPIRALYVTGGGWHDYERQKVILTEGLGERMNVEWEIEHEAGERTDHWPSRFNEEKWMKGYDVVIYNFCILGAPGPEPVEKLVKMHAELNVPPVFVHGAMHSFRTSTEEWRKCCGVRSERHEGQRPFKVEVLKPKYPIMIGFPEGGWQTPQGELYEIEEVYENTTPLAHAYGKDTERYHEVIWTNLYHGVRVFGTTIGHHNETMEDEVFLDTVSRGVLWAVGRLDLEGKPFKK